MEDIKLWKHGAPGAIGNGIEDTPSLKPFTLEGDEEKAAIIICPGGGYVDRAWHEGEPVAKWLNRIGIHAFVLNYRVAPYSHPYPFMDACRAVSYVRFNAVKWNINSKKIGILGFSAGGHLAAMVGTHFTDSYVKSKDEIDKISCRPDLMVLAYPVISFDKYTHEGSKVNLLGEEVDDESIFYFSNEHNVTDSTPPTFLWHTADDESVHVQNSILFSVALKEKNIPFELHIYDSGPHGMGLANEDVHVGSWTRLCAEWLKRQGF